VRAGSGTFRGLQQDGRRSNGLTGGSHGSTACPARTAPTPGVLALARALGAYEECFNFTLIDMTHKKATDQAVFAAAEDLLTQGLEPTLKLLQERTSGSYTTVQNALARWKEACAAEQQQEPAPPEVTAKAGQFARLVWHLAKQQADLSVQEVRRGANLAAQAARDELAHAQEQIRNLEQERSGLFRQQEDARAAVERERSRPHMHFVPVKSAERQGQVALHRLREGYKEKRSACINRIRGLLTEFGLVFPKRPETLRRVLMDVLEDASNELPGLVRLALSEAQLFRSTISDPISQANFFLSCR
jgi:hypothetical protein